jgi:aspartate/tyrosine/aromatic aminotransferase
LDSEALSANLTVPLSSISAFRDIQSVPNIDKLMKKLWPRQEFRKDQNPKKVDLTIAEILDERTNLARHFKAVQQCEKDHLVDPNRNHGYDVSPAGNGKIRQSVMEFLYNVSHPAMLGM